MDKHWWIIMGYDAFDAGPDGFPLPGKVTKHYRSLKKRHDGRPWTQRDLAFVLGISEQEVRNLENHDHGFSLQRRRFLAQLFNIPPILYGVVTQEQIDLMLSGQQASLPGQAIITTKNVRVDLDNSRQILADFWRSNHAHSAQPALADMHARIFWLEEEYRLVNGRQKAECGEVLSGYHQLIAHILRDEQRFDTALIHARQALELTEHLTDRAPYVTTLLIQGSILREQWQQLSDAHALQATLEVLGKAQVDEKKVSSAILAALFLRIGLAQARTAQRERERTEALKMMDHAATIIRTACAGDDILKTDLHRYHLDRSEALIALGCLKDAEAELNLIDDDPAAQRRSVYRDILLARLYESQGKYDLAIAYAEPALQAAKRLNSCVNIKRVADLYAQLKNSPFKNNPEVERLAWLLSSH